MCYNNCPYESYNAGSGNCTCHRGKNPCPETLEYCEECHAVITEDEISNALESTEDKYQLCSKCLTFYLSIKTEEINLKEEED